MDIVVGHEDDVLSRKSSERVPSPMGNNRPNPSLNDEEEQAACEICWKEVKNNRDLHNHLIEVHAKHQCTRCHTVCANLNSLKLHIERECQQREETAIKEDQRERDTDKENRGNAEEVGMNNDNGERSLLYRTSGEAFKSQNHSEEIHRKEGCTKVDEGVKPEKHAKIIELSPEDGQCAGDDVPSKSNVCHYCGKSFKKSFYVKKHVQKVHLNFTPFACKDCGKGFKSKRGVLKHLDRACSKRPHELNREDCDDNNEFGHFSEEEKIELLRSSVREARVQGSPRCKFCDRTLAEYSKLRNHISSLHLKLLIYNCKLCGARFPTSIGLRRHEQNEHEKKRYSCKMCLKEFATHPKLKRHCLQVHKISLDSQTAENDDSRQISCDICGKHFNNLGKQRYHMKFFHGNAPEPPPGVDRELFDILVKTVKDAREQGVPRCVYCGKTRSDFNGLQRHIASVHMNLKLHKCDSCDQSFFDESKLKRHKRNVHEKANSPGKIFQCDKCPKSYSTKGSLTTHILSKHETTERVATCRVCNEGFRSSYFLKLHMKDVHPDIDPKHKSDSITELKSIFKDAVLAKYSSECALESTGANLMLLNNENLDSAQGKPQQTAQSINNESSAMNSEPREILFKEGIPESQNFPQTVFPALPKYQDTIYSEDLNFFNDVKASSILQTSSVLSDSDCISNDTWTNKLESKALSSWTCDNFTVQHELDKVDEIGDEFREKCTELDQIIGSGSQDSNLSEEMNTMHSTNSNRMECTTDEMNIIISDESESVKEEEARSSRSHLDAIQMQGRNWCDECEREFKSEGQLRRHFRQVHGEDSPVSNKIPCEECGQLFTKTYLPTHLNTHKDSQSRKVECQYCGLSFSERYLKKHCNKFHRDVTVEKKKSKKMQIFPCEHGCSESFDTVYQLALHHWRAHNFG